MNRIAIWTVVILGGLFALFMLTAPTAEEAAKNNAPSVDNGGIGNTSLFDSDSVDLDSKPKLFIGDPDAPVTLVEYGDFKCPSCNSFHHQAGQRIREEYVDTGKINIEFRNYPFIGPDSGRAARGAYCANSQGAFTAYHDAVYNDIWDSNYVRGDYSVEYSDIYSVDKILEVTGGLVDDPAALRTCIESTGQDGHIDTDIALARQDGVSGTPGFVIDGRPLNGPSNFSTFKVLLDAQLR